jgi:hypothetical protein
MSSGTKRSQLLEERPFDEAKDKLHPPGKPSALEWMADRGVRADHPSLVGDVVAGRTADAMRGERETSQELVAAPKRGLDPHTLAGTPLR